MAKKPKQKTKTNVPGAEADIGHNGGPPAGAELDDNERRELFLRHVDHLADAEEKLASVTAELRNVRKRIKADGFAASQVKAAVQMRASPEAEEREREKLQEVLDAARWLGIPWGTQFDLFPGSVANAHDEGWQASATNKPRKPPYEPSTVAYGDWMAGYDKQQEQLASRVGKGNPPAAGEEITSGERVTRSEFKQRLQGLSKDDPKAQLS